MTDREKEILATLRGINDKLDAEDSEKQRPRIGQIWEALKYFTPAVVAIVLYAFNAELDKRKTTMVIEYMQAAIRQQGEQIAALQSGAKATEKAELDALREKVKQLERKP